MESPECQQLNSYFLHSKSSTNMETKFIFERCREWWYCLLEHVAAALYICVCVCSSPLTSLEREASWLLYKVSYFLWFVKLWWSYHTLGFPSFRQSERPTSPPFHAILFRKTALIFCHHPIKIGDRHLSRGPHASAMMKPDLIRLVCVSGLWVFISPRCFLYNLTSGRRNRYLDFFDKKRQYKKHVKFSPPPHKTSDKSTQKDRFETKSMWSQTN